MAKKPAKSDRQAVIDSIRNKQRGAEKRRGLAIVGVCVVIALLIVGAAAYQPIKDWYELRQFKDLGLADIGAPASACQDIETKKADGNQDHVDPGTPITPETSPPAFGQHWSQWDTIGRKLYVADDRPDLGELIHNLEHGYTLLWYDETVAADEDQMQQLRAIADKFDGDDKNYRNKFKVVPWTETDGAPFPDGQHVAITHWSVAGKNDSQQGVFQYCSETSGAALETFMVEYPYTDSPEPEVL